MTPENDLPPSILQSAIETVIKNLESLYMNKSTSGFGIETGFWELDQALAGLQPGQLVVLASRPGAGKTAFSLNIAENMILSKGQSVSIFNMEIPIEQLASRMMASVGRLEHHGIRTANIRDHEWPKLTDAIDKLEKTSIDLIDPLKVGWSAQDLERTLLENLIKPAVLIVDGLHSLDVTTVASAYDRNIQLTEQVRRFKKMAMEMQICIILTCSLNREPESRPNKRPLLKDLRDIGGLEDLADVILFIYREDTGYSSSSPTDMAELIIAKQRNGALGTVRLEFLKEAMRFDSLPPISNKYEPF